LYLSLFSGSAVSSGLRSDRHRAAVGVREREREVAGLAAADTITGSG